MKDALESVPCEPYDVRKFKTLAPDPLIARYDLSKKHFPFTWDCATFFVKARAAGATGIDFNLAQAVSTKWPMEESVKRFWNYIEPMPPMLFGMKSSIDKGGKDLGLSVRMEDLPADFERMKLPDIYIRDRGHFTVTLRDTTLHTHKNSDQSVWREFAKLIGAVVIEDSRIRPIALQERFALYAGARMNYGVPNGPFSVLWYTEYPMTMFSDPVTTRKGWSGHSIEPGDKISFMRANQHLVWEKPTVDILMKAHGLWIG